MFIGVGNILYIYFKIIKVMRPCHFNRLSLSYCFPLAFRFSVDAALTLNQYVEPQQMGFIVTSIACGTGASYH